MEPPPVYYGAMREECAAAFKEAPGQSDRDDVAAFGEGDEKAFERLVTRYEGKLYRLAYRMLGQRENAMDAVQEAFLRIYRSIKTFRGDAAFKGWAYAITLNVCRTMRSSAGALKERKTRSLSFNPADDMGAPMDPPAYGPDPEESAMGREFGLAVKRTLAALPSKHREILVLREIEGLDYEEMAAALKCARGTVKSRLARARSAFRRALEDTWP